MFPGENILEIDLNLNEILKKTIDVSKLESIDDCTLKVIDLKDLVNNFNSFKELLESIDIICIVSNSIMSNIENTQKYFLNLKEKVSNVDYYVIANFQDRKEAAVEVEKIEELLKEKTFGFSAIQKDSKERIISIIENILRLSVINKKDKKHILTKHNEIWSELENARINDTEGDKVKAIERFSNAASQFKKLYSEVKIRHDQDELNVLHYLCKAWESMIYAEEYKEPKKFSEAMNYFIQVSEIVKNNKLKLLALGNSEYCKILKLGMEFEQSNQTYINENDYLEIKAIFNKIADLYKQGGFQKELNWALTTSSYFDTFVKDLKKA